MVLKKYLYKIILYFSLILTFSCQNKYPDLEDGIYAEFITNKGVMVAKLYYQEAPNTVANFISLAEGTNTLVDSIYKGKKFYNSTIFHVVIDSFIIQGGDPTETGQGNAGYWFDDEFAPNLRHDKPGVLGMANDGPKTNGSQFYITETANPFLDNVHSIFGELVLGLDVLDSISNVKTSEIDDRPLEDITLEEVNIIKKGVKAKTFDAAHTFINHFAELERLEDKRIKKEQNILLATKKKFDPLQKSSIQLSSGLQYVITKKGTGEKLTENTKVLVNYSVYFDDGKLLQTSKLDVAKSLDVVDEERKIKNGYQPIKADLSANAKMITGFKEGLQQLSVGDKATLFIPYYLAYGDTGNAIIPPNSNLIFEVEVLELTK